MITEYILYYIGRLGKFNSYDESGRIILRLVRINCKYEGIGIRNKILVMFRNNKGIKCGLNLRLR